MTVTISIVLYILGAASLIYCVNLILKQAGDWVIARSKTGVVPTHRWDPDAYIGPKLDVEALQCALISFDLLEQRMPEIKKESWYIVARAQLDHGMGRRTFQEAIVTMQREANA